MFKRGDVAGSWPELVQRVESRGSWRRWAAAEPELARLAGPAQLPTLVRPGCDAAAADALIGALLRWAAADGGGDPDAVLILLHVLSEGAVALARTVAYREVDGLPLVVSELTCQIRSFPWRRRTRAYAANLLLDTRRALSAGELRPSGDRFQPEGAVPVDPAQLTDPGWLGSRIRSGTDSAAHAELDLADLFTWAADRGVAPAADLAQLLHAQARGSGKVNRRELAAGLGVTERTVRRRHRRTLTALRNCRHAYLAEVA